MSTCVYIYFKFSISIILYFYRINSVTQAQMQHETYSGGCMGPRGVRLWLFVGLILGFAAVIASCWIFFYVFVGKDSGK